MTEQQIAQVVCDISHGMRVIAEALADLAELMEAQDDLEDS
jgi:hypothetical protein